MHLWITSLYNCQRSVILILIRSRQIKSTLQKAKNQTHMQIQINALKGEVTYTMPLETEKQIIEAEKLQTRLYKKYNSVRVVTAGLNRIRIIASN